MDTELGEVQAAFADIVWKNEPVNSGELVKICEKKLNWKKPTTYTVLRKLCEKGIFINNNGTVTSLISRERFYAEKCDRIIKASFNGSIPSFFAAFMSEKSLSDEEADELQKLIDNYRKG